MSFALALCAVSSAACRAGSAKGGAGASAEGGAGSSTDAGSRAARTIESSDRRFALTVPAAWTVARPKSSEQLRLESGSLVVFVEAYAKEDLVVQTLDDFESFIYERYANYFDEVTDCVPKPFASGTRKALRCEVNASKDGFNYVYSFTAIETDEEWNVVIANGMKSQFRFARADIETIASSFSPRAR